MLGVCAPPSAFALPRSPEDGPTYDHIAGMFSAAAINGIPSVNALYLRVYPT
jgi:hypothetical protein